MSIIRIVDLLKFIILISKSKKEISKSKSIEEKQQQCEY